MAHTRRIQIDLLVDAYPTPATDAALENLAAVMMAQAEDGLYAHGYKESEDDEELGPNDYLGDLTVQKVEVVDPRTATYHGIVKAHCHNCNHDVTDITELEFLNDLDGTCPNCRSNKGPIDWYMVDGTVSHTWHDDDGEQHGVEGSPYVTKEIDQIKAEALVEALKGTLPVTLHWDRSPHMARIPLTDRTDEYAPALYVGVEDSDSYRIGPDNAGWEWMGTIGNVEEGHQGEAQDFSFRFLERTWLGDTEREVACQVTLLYDMLKHRFADVELMHAVGDNGPLCGTTVLNALTTAGDDVTCPDCQHLEGQI